MYSHWPSFSVLICMVHPWPKGNRPGTRVTAPRETDPQQTSCGNQRFFRAMLVITMILRDSIYWDSAWQALPKVFYYIYHAYCVSSTFLNIYTYIIYVYTQKSHNFSFASHVSLSESLCTDTHTHTHTHTHRVKFDCCFHITGEGMRTLCPRFSG